MAKSRAQYIEEQGMIKMSSNLNNQKYFNYDDIFENIGQSNNNKVKIIIPFIL